LQTAEAALPEAVSLERDEEKCVAVFRPHPASQILESITFMILDRFDPKSS
jgi:hypothetical protein